MRKYLYVFLFLIQSSIASAQTFEYLNFMEMPVVDISKYGYEYFKIVLEEKSVRHTQIFTKDTIKVRHTTALLDENGNIKSGRTLTYFPNGETESTKRFDNINSASEEKTFYSNGALKSEIIVNDGELVSEVYYSETGEVIPKPIIEDPAPKGGMKEWNNHLARNLRYPPDARAAKAEGTVLLEFDLNEKGEIGEVRVGNPEFIHKALWVEAVRVIKIYPKNWIPKKENGVPVPSTVRLPIRFKLS
ncbi:energy transducer TonB [Algoriphagus limi]|uniref:TonB family protein n=1 Tax=Algoriphagus limi TaxID=2975273 RepID=A0ABT2G241_9BACT|nr:energy transducer TonB [Algoriphagus limi]MCS5489311.1 TonB family protein [Algoriphagus limi]